MNKLKPCPFCGEPDIKIMKSFFTVFEDKYYCFCPECGSRSFESFSEKQTVDAWNRRAFND